jgi:hypothetical protein
MRIVFPSNFMDASQFLSNFYLQPAKIGWIYLVKVRPRLLNLKAKDTSQTLATLDSFDPMGGHLMSTHLPAG